MGPRAIYSREISEVFRLDSSVRGRASVVSVRGRFDTVARRELCVVIFVEHLHWPNFGLIRCPRRTRSVTCRSLLRAASSAGRESLSECTVGRFDVSHHVSAPLSSSRDGVLTHFCCRWVIRPFVTTTGGIFLNLRQSALITTRRRGRVCVNVFGRGKNVARDVCVLSVCSITKKCERVVFLRGKLVKDLWHSDHWKLNVKNVTFFCYHYIHYIWYSGSRQNDVFFTFWL